MHGANDFELRNRPNKVASKLLQGIGCHVISFMLGEYHTHVWPVSMTSIPRLLLHIFYVHTTHIFARVQACFACKPVMAAVMIYCNHFLYQDFHSNRR